MVVDLKKSAKCKSPGGFKHDSNLKARLSERCKAAIFLELFFFFPFAIELNFSSYI